MTKRYLTLQTKLKELESTLNHALLCGPEEHSHEVIKQKLAFVGNLLSAEVACNPSKPHHLQHISEMLSSLEKTFHERDTQRTFSISGEFDKDSSCSCTATCLNDDGEALDDTELIVFYDPEKLFPDFVGEEKAIVEFRGNGVRENGDKIKFFEDAENEFFEVFVGEKEKRKDDELRREEGSGKNYCYAMGGGVVIGMILMGFIMVNFSGCFHYVEQATFAIPT